MMSYINETDFVIENKELVYPEIITDGLQLYYDAKGKRDTDYHRETMLDMSGNKNHGKLHNFAYEKHSGYKDGLVFDYIDDKLVRPELDLQPDDFTFMLNGNIISFSPDGTVKRVQDGEVIESKGFNLVRNGDFVDGSKGWRVPNTEDIFKVVKGLAIVQAGKQYGGLGQNMYSRDKMPIAGHKYYFCANVERQSSGIQLYLNDGRGQDPASGPDTGFISNIRTLSEDPTTLLLKLQDNKSSSWTESKISNIIVINLTETFSAGNEPTKEQMDEIINRFRFVPNAQDLIDRIEYKGNDLGDMENIIDGLYKIEVLSGQEIYTDKADDAGVHVEVDGKSYQHAGNGKNMFNKYLLSDRSKFELATYSSSPAIQLKPNTTHVLSASRVNPSPDGNQLVLNIMDATGGIPAYGSPEYNDRRIKAVFNMYGEHSGFDDFRAVFNTPESGLIFFSYYDRDSGKSSEGNWFTDVMIDAQLEEGSITTEYEPPVQSPDYPIEIHSLNDFDVVSSVGGENLIENRFLKSTFTTTGPIEWNNTTAVKPIMYSSNTDVSPYYPAGQYIFSVEIKVAKNDPQVASIRISSGTKGNSFSTVTYLGREETVSGEWVKISRTFNLTEPSQIGLQMYPHSFRDEFASYVAIRNMKLEKDRVTDFNPSSKDIPELSSDPLIDKINLLLDEPLRSVRDDKDRLFRDSDGLWKIERNVHYEVLSSSTPNWTHHPSYNTNNAISTRLIRSSHTHSLSWSDICSSHFIETVNAWAKDEAGIGHSSANGTSVWMQIPRSVANNLEEAKQWADEQVTQGTPIQIMYPLKENKYIETLSQSLQDKLNNLRSFSESNYVYTVDGNTNLLDTVPLLDNHWYPNSGAQQTPVSNIGQTATQEPLSVYPGAKVHLTKIETAVDNFWRIVWVDKNNNVIRRETSTANDLVLTAPNRTYGMRVSYPNDSNAVIKFDKSDISQTVSDNLKPTLHAKFLYNNWYKEDRVINNLMIYNRALTNEEMLQNYRTIKRRWGM